MATAVGLEYKANVINSQDLLTGWESNWTKDVLDVALARLELWSFFAFPKLKQRRLLVPLCYV